MLTVIGLLKTKPSPNGAQHGERSFWAELGPMYLDRWIHGVHKHVPQPHEIVVMTDLDEITPGVRRVPLGSDAPGFWAKLEMFRPEVSSGTCLYLDLDNVLCGPLDELCALVPDPLVMMDDRHVPRLPNGSAMLFDAERCRDIWDSYAFEDGSEYIHQVYVPRGEDYSRAYDQGFIAAWHRRMHTMGRIARPDVPLFQELLPRDYCLNAFSELPGAEDWSETRLIFGCGGTAKPHLMSHHPAIAEHWAA